MSDVEDRRLVGDCLDGNPAAFETLVEKYNRVLYNIALGMVKEPEDASDITQAAFIKAYEKLNTYKPKFKFFSWIYRITINEALNHLSKRKMFEELDSGIMATGRTPDEDYETARLDDRIRSALIELNVDYRIVIVLRHFLHMSLREMGSVLGVPEKTVKSRLYTARQQMGGILLKQGMARA
jgi:RNA polymerase sigma-70 factor (ECF subfamily)